MRLKKSMKIGKTEVKALFPLSSVVVKYNKSAVKNVIENFKRNHKSTIICVLYFP